MLPAIYLRFWLLAMFSWIEFLASDLLLLYLLVELDRPREPKLLVSDAIADLLWLLLYLSLLSLTSVTVRPEFLRFPLRLRLWMLGELERLAENKLSVSENTFVPDCLHARFGSRKPTLSARSVSSCSSLLSSFLTIFLSSVCSPLFAACLKFR